MTNLSDGFQAFLAGETWRRTHPYEHLHLQIQQLMQTPTEIWQPPSNMWRLSVFVRDTARLQALLQHANRLQKHHVIGLHYFNKYGIYGDHHITLEVHTDQKMRPDDDPVDVLVIHDGSLHNYIATFHKDTQLWDGANRLYLELVLKGNKRKEKVFVSLCS